jgi:hypothetical protein
VAAAMVLRLVLRLESHTPYEHRLHPTFAFGSSSGTNKSLRCYNVDSQWNRSVGHHESVVPVSISKRPNSRVIETRFGPADAEAGLITINSPILSNMIIARQECQPDREYFEEARISIISKK